MPLPVIALLFTAIVLQVSGTAWARDVDAVMSTGREGGSYYLIGQRLQRMMATEHGVWIDVLTSRGSLANLAKLDDPSSPVGLTLTQADALNRYLQSHPEFADEFIVLGDAGKECVFLIAGSAGSVTTAANLKEAAGGEISVDDSDSGASVTFEYMTQLEPRFGATTASPVDTMEALLQLKMATKHTQLKAVMVVQRPKAFSTPIRVALENPDDYRLIPITEADVGNARLPNGSVVYSFERVEVGGLQRSAEIDTICTRGLLLVSTEKLSKDLRSQLSTLMLESASKIIGFDE